jgi:hypothetical protein
MDLTPLKGIRKQTADSSCGSSEASGKFGRQQKEKHLPKVHSVSSSRRLPLYAQNRSAQRLYKRFFFVVKKLSEDSPAASEAIRISTGEDREINDLEATLYCSSAAIETDQDILIGY